MSLKDSEKKQVNSILQSNNEPDAAQDSVFSEDAMKRLEQEDKRVEEFKGRELEAFAIGAGGAISFGALQQFLVKSGIYTKEELRELEERNELGSLAGEVAGTVGSLITPGGQAGLIAKTIGTGGKAVRGAVKAGQAVEQQTVKALGKVLADTGEKKFAKEAIRKAVPLAAGSSVEGAAFGVGELIKENALGTADFNAENLITYAGGGALLGGGLGAGIGASLPLMSLGKKGARKVGQAVSGKVGDYTDPKIAAGQLLGWTPRKMAKNEAMLDDVVSFLNTEVNVASTKSAQDIADRVQSLLKESADGIPRVLKQIDDLGTQFPDLLPQRSALDPSIATVNKYLDEIGSLSISKEHAGKLRALRKDLVLKRNLPGNLGAQELQTFRKAVDDLANFKKLEGITPVHRAAREVRTELRKIIDDMADSTGRFSPEAANLGKELKRFNKNAHIGLQTIESLKTRALKEDSFLSLKDMLLGGFGAGYIGPESLIVLGGKKVLESDFRRRLAVTGFLEKANQNVSNTVDKALKSFFAATKSPAAATMKAGKVELVQSLVAKKSKEGKIEKPKTEKEALLNIRDNIKELATNPEKLEKRAISSVYGLSQIAPETATSAQQILARAVAFLSQKLPSDVQLSTGARSLFREPEISELELSKFKRYIQTVESPMTLLDDLQDGTATFEQVEAVKAVYPDLYSRIVDKTYEYISDNKESLPFNKKIQLGVLLDFPTDSSLRPDAFADLQNNFRLTKEKKAEDAENARIGAAQGRAPNQLSVVGLREMKIAERENSEAQSFVSRRRG